MPDSVKRICAAFLMTAIACSVLGVLFARPAAAADALSVNSDDGVRSPLVALLDTGAPRGKHIEGTTSMLGDDGVDRNGHATLMLETMREQNPDAHIMSVKVLDDEGHGEAADVHDGIMYAVNHGADILNLSFAGVDNESNKPIREAVRYALDKGVVVIATAGNGGYDADLMTPANIEGVFTVGAAECGRVRDSSNRGACIAGYVEADSTSVAAAKVSGCASLGLDGWYERVSETLLVVAKEGADSHDSVNGDSEGVDASWEHAPYVYAALNYSSGELIFFKSNDEYSSESGQAVTDIEGNSYPGQMYKNFVNANYTSGSSVPWYNQRTRIKTVTFAQVIAPKSTAYWFYGCTNLVTFDRAGRLDTSAITNMNSMFYQCSSATFNPNVSSWNTSSVKYMQHMFAYCSGAAFNPNVSAWDTSSTTNMSGMFQSCYGAAFNPNVSAWDTSSVTDMSSMFHYCYGAAFSPDVSAWNTSAVMAMPQMFYYCYGNRFDPDVSSWDTSAVTDMNGMFSHCYGTAFSPDVSAWDTSSVTNMTYMFESCYGAAFNPNVSAWDTSSVTNMFDMFGDCYGAAFNPNVSSWNTSSVTNMSQMFFNCYGAAFNPNVSAWDTSSVTNMSGMFNKCYGAAFNPNVSSWNTSSVTNMQNMFFGCTGTAFTSLDMSSWDVSSVTNMSGMFSGCAKLVTLYANVGSDWNVRTTLTSSNNMFSGCSLLVGGNGTTYNSSIINKTYARIDGLGGTPGYFTVKEVPKTPYVYAVLDSSGTITFFKSNNEYNDGTETPITDIDGNSYTGQVYRGFINIYYTSYSNIPWYNQRESIKTVVFAQEIAPKSTAYWFYGCTNLMAFDSAGKLDTSSVTSMRWMFYNCFDDRLNPNVVTWDTSSVMSMESVFQNCHGAAFNPNVSSWNTSSVTNMSQMFRGCYGDTFSPDVSSWDTSSVTNMSYMFQNCYGAAFNPNVSSWDTSSVKYMSNMFNSCRSAQFNPDVSAWDTSSVTSMGWMFYNCSGDALNPDVSSWDTSSVTDMSYLFSGCFGAAFHPNVFSWDTSSSMNMSYMFSNCGGAAFNPDVSSWDTSSVTNMEAMFSSCHGVAFTSLDLSSWDTSCVTSMRGMFSDCANLRRVKLGANFLFRDYMATSSAEGALPTPPTTPSYTGKWVNSSVAGANAVSPAELTANYDGHQTTGDYARGTYVWEMIGTAYAVLDANGTLTFVRSLNSYSAGSNQTVIDTAGHSYTGQVFTDFETASPYANNDDAPWYSQRLSIRNVTIADGQVIMPQGTTWWFYECSNLVEFSNAANLDTSGVVSMGGMFYGCSSMVSPPDASSWNTSSVIAMWSMFRECSSMCSPPNTGSWNTKNVINMSHMFRECSSLTLPPDTSGWNTGSVIYMNSMFQSCSAMASSPIAPHWDTHSATNMAYMFYDCYSLPSLDISSFDFTQVIDESHYLGLHGCTSLQQLTVAAGSKITGLPEHAAAGTYLSTWKNDFQSIAESTAANLISVVNAGNGAGIWEWEERSAYVVTFVTGNAVMATQEIDSGTTATLTSVASMVNIPVTPTNGWSFGGWATAVDTTTTAYADGQSVTDIDGGSGAVTLYAVYQRSVPFVCLASATATTPTTTNVTQHYRNGSATAAGVTSIWTPPLYANTSTNASYQGLAPLGWRTDASAQAATVTQTGAAAVSLTPAANAVPPTYYAVYSRSVTFYHGYDMAANTPVTQYYNANDAWLCVTPAATACTDIAYWEKLGWRDDTTAGAQEYGFGTTITASANTYYAVYCQTPAMNYASGGGSGTTASTSGAVRHMSSGNTTLPNATWVLSANGFSRTGYTFSQWNFGNAGATYSTAVAWNEEPSRVATAVWQAISYTVQFDANGGTGSMANQTFRYDEEQSLSSNAFTRRGYEFAGWDIQVYHNPKEVGKNPGTGQAEWILYDYFESIFRRYGTDNPYVYAFDAKSLSVANQNSVKMYLMNEGNGISASYVFAPTNDISFPVTETYATYTFDTQVIPTTYTDNRANVSFYGEYGTGNNPWVKNMYVRTKVPNQQSIINATCVAGEVVTAVAQWRPLEMSGTVDFLNPDTTGDGIGDNISFTAPTAITFAVKADGTLVAPTNAAIVNRGSFDIHLSSLDARAVSPYSLVQSLSTGDASDQVRLSLTTGASSVSMADYLGKAALPASADWNVLANSSLPLGFSGKVGSLSRNIASAPSKFATITWYVTPERAGT